MINSIVALVVPEDIPSFLRRLEEVLVLALRLRSRIPKNLVDEETGVRLEVDFDLPATVLNANLLLRPSGAFERPSTGTARVMKVSAWVILRTFFRPSIDLLFGSIA
jgi:hypothetical protein